MIIPPALVAFYNIVVWYLFLLHKFPSMLGYFELENTIFSPLDVVIIDTLGLTTLIVKTVLSSIQGFFSSCLTLRFGCVVDVAKLHM